MIKLTPIERNSPQHTIAERLAVLLAENGVQDTMALTLAIQILGGIQAAIDADNLTAAIAEWDRNREAGDRWALKYAPRTKHSDMAFKRITQRLIAEGPNALVPATDYGLAEGDPQRTSYGERELDIAVRKYVAEADVNWTGISWHVQDRLIGWYAIGDTLPKALEKLLVKAEIERPINLLPAATGNPYVGRIEKWQAFADFVSQVEVQP